MPSFSNRVLIVDDDVAVVEVLETLLHRLSLSTDAASNFEEAVRQLSGTTYGCALVDKNLPDKGGLEVVKEVRRQQPYCACIVMTGFPTLESSLEALRSGVTDYLQKPFMDLEAVGRKVTSAIADRWLTFERDSFVRQLKEVGAQLRRKELTIAQQRTDLELLQEVIEYRVNERTMALQKRVEELEAKLKTLGG